MTIKKYIVLCAILILLILIAISLWSTFSLQVNTYTIQCSGLPAGFDNFRIAHISDLHNEEFGKQNGKLLDAIRAAKPHIIVITGDLIDSYNTNVDISIAFMEEASKIAPCYYVRGNHENRLPTEYSLLRDKMVSFGVTVLEDESVTLTQNGDTIRIAGLMDYASLSENYLSGTFPREGYTVLLTHRPEHFELYANAHFDLVLSGHTHGGQLRLPLIGALFLPGQGVMPKYVDGLHTSGSTSMIISRGLGNSSIPFRFLSFPELVIVELQCE